MEWNGRMVYWNSGMPCFLSDTCRVTSEVIQFMQTHDSESPGQKARSTEERAFRPSGRE